MLEQRCIYCSPNKPAETRCTDEHVIPQAFGKFKPNNLVLNQGVCDDCNQFFGRTIDLLLGRGSAESVLRFDYQLKSIQKVKEIFRDRVRFTLSSNDRRFDGLVMEYGNEDGELVVLLEPQVGFPRLNGAGWIYITQSDLEDTTKPLPAGIDTQGTFIPIYNSEQAKQQLTQLLMNRGLNPQQEEEETLPYQVGNEVDISVTGVIDEMIYRGIAKIAFNYLAKTAGIDFVTKSSFDLVRQYIRNGILPNYQVVTKSRKHISGNVNDRMRHTVGHWIITDWSNGDGVIAQVSLFNLMVYQVVLSQKFSGIWRPIRSGHYFNIETKEVEDLA